MLVKPATRTLRAIVRWTSNYYLYFSFCITLQGFSPYFYGYRIQMLLRQ